MNKFRSMAVTLCLAASIGLTGCATPEMLNAGPRMAAAQITENSYITADGEYLKLSRWHAKSPRAVFVAVHGFNEYAGDFRLPAPKFAKNGISVIGYDQRGFGRTDGSRRGKWAGGDIMADDLARFVELIRKSYTGLPVYVLGTSMGGAVTMKASVDNAMQADGLILVAPAIWGWRSMNPILKSALWVTAHTVPSNTATGSQLKIWPSDNIEWLREYSRDKHNIKESRFDTLYGLVTLMDEAANAAPKIETPVLYLYGSKDEVVPAEPSRKVMAAITAPNRLIEYDNGYHMLLHDLQREKVYRDILQWVDEQPVAIPVASR
jgi:alpha-beta hydrolase superfamily lysophospholipase